MTLPVRKPVRRSLSHQVLESMETLICEGAWKVGDRIPSEPELMKLFQVSHNTIREAVQGLTHAGMLIARPGDGTYVTATDRLDAALAHRLKQADMGRILEARLAIEKAIVALAAIHCTQEDVEAMEEALARFKERRGDGIEDDMAFHLCIANATRNPILSQIYRVIAAYLSQHFAATLCERQYEPAAIALHESLIDAMRQRDASAAQQLVARIVEFDTDASA